MKRTFLSLFIGLITFTSLDTKAVTRTWDGSSSGNWATAANWNGGIAPVAGDDLVFPAGVTRTNMTNNFSPNRGFNSVTFLGTNYTINGSTLMVTNGIISDTAQGDNLHRIPNTIATDVQLGGSQTFAVSNTFTRLVILGDIALVTHTLTIDGDGDSIYSGSISGTGGITKDGFGICNLEADNSFSGAVLIRDGRIRAMEPLSLGTTSGNTTVRQNALLEMQASVTNETLVLSGGGWFINSSPCRWRGTVNVISNSAVDAAGDLILDGVLSGSAQISIDTFISGLDAEMTLTGTAANTLTGPIRLEEGRLILSKPGLVDAVAGPLIIGDGSGTSPTNAIVRYGPNSDQMRGANVTIMSDGMLDMSGKVEFINTLTMIGGVVTNSLSTGFLEVDSLGDNDFKITSAGATPARIYGRLSLGSDSPYFFVTNGPASVDLEILGQMTGSVGFVKEGDGVMSLVTSNSFTGNAQILNGTLQVDDDFAFGTLGGDRVAVRDGATLSCLAGANSISQNLALNGAGDNGAGALRSVGTMSWDGEVILASDSVINVASGTLSLSNQISGVGGFAKIGAGTLRLAGSGDNIYAGDTTVRAGILTLSKTSAFAISNSAALNIGDASDDENTDIVRYFGDNQLRTTVNIFINRTGLLDFNDFTDDVGDISLTGGEIQTGIGVLQLRGNVTAIGDVTPGNPLPGFDTALISGNLDLGSSTRTFTVNNNSFLGGAPNDLVIDAVITGTGGIAKSGAGELELNAINTYSGLTTINAGRIVARSDAALGANSVGTVINGTATLELQNNIVLTEPITNSSASAISGAILSFSGTNQCNGNLALTQTAFINVESGSRLDIGGAISGVGGLTKVGPAVLAYVGSIGNSYTGTTTVNEGTLLLAKTLGNASVLGDLVIGDGTGGANSDIVRLQNNSQLSTATLVTVNSSGLFDINGLTESFGSLAGSGNVTLGGATLNPGFDNTSTVFSGVISESGNFTKGGTGTMTLSGNNTYTGTTTVNAGTLLVNGSQPQSPVNVTASATLGGTGTVGNIIGNGSIAPGASPGILTCSNLTFSAGGDFLVDLTGSSPGSGYDQINVRGTNNLASATLHVNPDFTSIPSVNQQFTIINNDGSDPIVGTFNGLPEGAGFTAAGFGFRINYAAGSGNDVVLTLTNVPSDYVFTNVLGGNFLDNFNWIPNLVPTRTNNAVFVSNATYSVTWSANISNANAFFNANSGTVTQSIGAFTWLLTNSYVVGQNLGSTPAVTHASGTLRVTNSSGTGAMDLRRGTTRLSGGVIDVDRLMMTNGVGLFEFTGGTLITRGGVISNNDFTFSVGDGGNTPAIWNARAGANTVISNGLFIGASASACQFLVTNGGKIFGVGGTIGAGSVVSNLAFISGTGSVWSNSGGVAVGSGGSFGQLIVSNGGAVFSTQGHVSINGASANSNAVIVTGIGSVWSNNNGGLIVGYTGRGNRMIITNGGEVFNTTGIMGFDPTGEANVSQVTGTNSLWNNSLNLTVGQSGSSNQLVIQNGGTVFANGFTLGQSSTSTNNQSLVDSGTLRVTNSARTAILDTRRGGFTLSNGGTVEADIFRLTNGTLSSFIFNGGGLSVRSSIGTNGQTFFAGNGVSLSTLSLVGNGIHSFTGLTLRSNATLIGNGTIIGPMTVQAGATVSPGTSVGKFALTNSPSLQGNLVMEVSKAGVSRTNDQLQVNGALTYGGRLTVTDIGPDALAAGDSFKLFNAPSYSGAFANTILPTLAPGLLWTNRLLVDGTIQVINSGFPQFSNISLLGTNLIFGGSNGVPNGGFTVLGSTNVALPVTSWSLVTTGLFNGTGNFSFTNFINPAEPQRYFLLREP